MEKPTAIKVNNRYQITLPREICQQLGIEPGDELLVDRQGDTIVLLPKPKNPVDYLAGLHKEVWQNIDPQEYLRQEQAAW
ncbi:MAG: AbrB family transcriptional regulator [Anaerolineaceae bacterium]|nr:AbrB family transcriptional regulator [Anaerolineaceae bacterium]